jgi:hypothetical protein
MDRMERAAAEPMTGHVLTNPLSQSSSMATAASELRLK